MKEKTKNEIIHIFSKSNLDLYEITEVIANVLIALGLTYIDFKDKTKNNVKNTHDIVIQNVKEHGQTLPNSLARQGLLMLLWLEK